MLIVLLLLFGLAAGAFLAWRFRDRLAPSVALPLKGGFAASGSPVPNSLPASAPLSEEERAFLPPGLEADELEAEDLRWLLERQRAALQKEETAHLQRESAARLEELGLQLDALARRVGDVQERMEAWKGALLERDALQLAYEQLRSEHLDQQYGISALRTENERLQAELAEARKEALLDYEENERLKKQLALLRSLTREGF